MKLNDFKLECYFGKYEFTAPYLLTQSDCESMTTRELLAMEPGSETRYLDQWLGYTETWGDPELRAEIAKLYRGMKPEHVLVFHGAQEAIFALMNVLLDEGDHMIVMYPNYQSNYDLVHSIPGTGFSKWCLRDDSGSWKLDFDELEALIQPNTKVISINTPNNPTGYTLSNAELRKLAELCKNRGIYLFADEVYKGLEHDGESREWTADLYDKAISLGVMSKSYGLAGLRVGWLVSKDVELLESVVKFKHYLSICDSAPSEFLAKVGLRHGSELLERNKRIIDENVKLADAFFARHSALFSPRPMLAGPVAFHKLLLDMPVEDFCQMAVDKKGVLLLPATIFELDGQYFRMGYGRRGFAESLEQFEAFLIENGFAK